MDSSGGGSVTGLKNALCLAAAYEIKLGRKREKDWRCLWSFDGVNPSGEGRSSVSPQGLPAPSNLLVPWRAENSVFNSRHGPALLLGR